MAATNSAIRICIGWIFEISLGDFSTSSLLDIMLSTYSSEHPAAALEWTGAAATVTLALRAVKVDAGVHVRPWHMHLGHGRLRWWVELRLVIVGRLLLHRLDLTRSRSRVAWRRGCVVLELVVFFSGWEVSV